MPRNIVEIAHLLLDDYLNEETISVDMTMGNGFDTLFLAKKSKKVYAFEIQKEAILNSTKLFKDNNVDNVVVYDQSHENISKLEDDYEVVVFNLGYLPGSDKKITTIGKVTIAAIESVIKKKTLKALLIVAYPGHENGQIECEMLDDFFDNYDLKDYRLTKISVLKTKRKSPCILFIEKKEQN